VNYVVCVGFSLVKKMDVVKKLDERKGKGNFCCIIIWAMMFFAPPPTSPPTLSFCCGVG
jgi:hypothetical protein